MATWMVVEDEPDIYDVLLAMFELWGIDGAAFVDGREAVEWIDKVDRGEVVDDLPELAILDIRLPEVSGPEIGARLRKSPVLRSVATVLVTAYRLSTEQEDQVKAQADADLLLYKPLPPMPKFREILDNLIANRKAMSATLPPVSGKANIPASVDSTTPKGDAAPKVIVTVLPPPKSDPKPDLKLVDKTVDSKPAVPTGILNSTSRSDLPTSPTASDKLIEKETGMLSSASDAQKASASAAGNIISNTANSGKDGASSPSSDSPRSPIRPIKVAGTDKDSDKTNGPSTTPAATIKPETNPKPETKSDSDSKQSSVPNP